MFFCPYFVRSQINEVAQTWTLFLGIVWSDVVYALLISQCKMGEQYNERRRVTESVLYTSLLLYAYAYLSPMVMGVCKETTPGFITFPESLIFLLLVCDFSLLNLNPQLQGPDRLQSLWGTWIYTPQLHLNILIFKNTVLACWLWWHLCSVFAI